MGILTPSDSVARSKRENEDRRNARHKARIGGDGSVTYDPASQGFVNSEGQPVSDADYDFAFGAGKAQKFREGRAQVHASDPNTDPIPTGNQQLEEGQQYLNNVNQPVAPTKTTAEYLASAGAQGVGGFQGTGGRQVFDKLGTDAQRATGRSPTAASTVGGVNLAGTGLAGGSTPTEPTAPEIHRDKIDPLISGLGTYQNALFELSQDNTGLSAAEAQLRKATELANLQAAQNTQQSQAAALGQARGARNRGDRALLERQAVGEAGYIGTQAAHDAAVRRAESEGNLAILRANESDADRQFKLQAIKEAAGLGLNTAALELDISKANLGSLTDQLNRDQAFKQFGLELDERKTEALLGFTRDMGALQFQYDQMSVDDQNETDKLLMQKYGIDKQTMVALRQIKAQQDVNWTQFGLNLLSGAVTGGSAVAAAYVGRPTAKTS